MNNTSSYLMDQTTEIVEFSFTPGIVLKPLLSLSYVYQLKKIYNLYEYNFEPVDIIELNCLLDRALSILFAIFSGKGYKTICTNVLIK